MSKKAKLSQFRTQRQNANAHTPRGLGMLAKSIGQDGWIGGMTVAADGETFDGSARLETLADAMPDVEPIVVDTDGTRPVIVRRTDIPSADDPRAKRLGIAANRIQQVDYAPDPVVLADLAGEIDLSQFWNTDELAEILGEAAGNDAADPGADVDRAAELQEKWQTEVGQLWQIGRHRLLVGDCTVRENVERLMGGERAGAVVTDPPYGMAYEPNHDDRRVKHNYNGAGYHNVKAQEMILGDGEEYDPRPLMEFFSDTKEQFWFGADYYADRIPERLKGSWLVWDKRHGIEDMNFNTSHFEMCWSRVKHLREIIRCKWFGIQGTEQQDTRSRLHPTQKPVQVIEWILEHHTESDQVIADPYCGSGTTLVACERLGRTGRGIELSPAYAAVTLERLTGLGLDAHKVD